MTPEELAADNADIAGTIASLEEKAPARKMELIICNILAEILINKSKEQGISIDKLITKTIRENDFKDAKNEVGEIITKAEDMPEYFLNQVVKLKQLGLIP